MSKIAQNIQIDFYNKISDLLKKARQGVVQTVNRTMVYTYFEIGRMIVEEEQNGKERAEYGKHLLEELSKTLKAEFGKGFSVDNLENMRRFYLVYSISETVSRKFKVLDFQLGWSHYLKLIRIEDKGERKFYEIEAIQNNWSLRELRRQCDSALYQRLLLSKDKNAVKELSGKGQVIEKPKDALKDPYILEFVGLPESIAYSETELEQFFASKYQTVLPSKKELKKLIENKEDEGITNR